MLDVVLLVKGDIKHFVAKRPNPLLLFPSESMGSVPQPFST